MCRKPQLASRVTASADRSTGIREAPFRPVAVDQKKTLAPARAKSMAVAAPAGPAPKTRTSYFKGKLEKCCMEKWPS